MTRRGLPRPDAVDIELAAMDDDYYAEIHKRLHGDARRRFEAAVDAAWRAKQERAGSGPARV